MFVLFLYSFVLLFQIIVQSFCDPLLVLVLRLQVGDLFVADVDLAFVGLDDPLLRLDLDVDQKLVALDHHFDVVLAAVLEQDREHLPRVGHHQTAVVLVRHAAEPRAQRLVEAVRVRVQPAVQPVDLFFGQLLLLQLRLAELENLNFVFENGRLALVVVVKGLFELVALVEDVVDPVFEVQRGQLGRRVGQRLDVDLGQ